MKLRIMGRTINIKPKQVQVVKTRFGCRIIVSSYLPENVSEYQLEKLEDRIRSVLGRD